MLGAVLALSAVRDVLLIKDHSGAQAAEVRIGSSIVNPVSNYLRGHQGGTRYEAAFTATTVAAPADVRVVLTINGALVLLLGILPGGLMTLCAQAIVRMLTT